MGPALDAQYHVTPARLRDAGLYHCPMSYCSAYKGTDLMIEGTASKEIPIKNKVLHSDN